MTDKIYFVADVFAEDIQGGGELNNEEAIDLLYKRGFSVEKKRTTEITRDFIEENKESKFIIGNFIGLSEECKKKFSERTSYLIYEHDHKYLLTRDPSGFQNYVAPKNQVINRDFYKKASGVLCQSKLHKEVAFRNLEIDNIHNLGGNLWSDEILDFLTDLEKKTKAEKYSIWSSTNPIKNTSEVLTYCSANKIPYDLVGNLPYKEFLSRLTDNSTFIFLPKTLETLCRVIVEARIAGMRIVTNKNVGATSEEWFQLKGLALADRMREKKIEIVDTIVRILS